MAADRGLHLALASPTFRAELLPLFPAPNFGTRAGTRPALPPPSAGPTSPYSVTCPCCPSPRSVTATCRAWGHWPPFCLVHQHPCLTPLSYPSLAPVESRRDMACGTALTPPSHPSALFSCPAGSRGGGWGLLHCLHGCHLRGVERYIPPPSALSVLPPARDGVGRDRGLCLPTLWGTGGSSPASGPTPPIQA